MSSSKTRSRESRSAIEKLYISMRQFIIRGSYKPNGVSGSVLKEALRSLQPEIYGDLNHPEKTELEGLLYVAQRLPKGIEECALIKLVAREGYHEAGFTPQIPAKRRRNCYRIDRDRMYVEMSRGRSDIYDILTHLTFLVIEGEKILGHALDPKGRLTNNWLRLREIVEAEEKEEAYDEQQALAYLSNVLGRTPAETMRAVKLFARSEGVNSLFHFTYHLGQVAVRERLGELQREVFFSAQLREVMGHHVYGEAWASAVKRLLHRNKWLQRPLHIISANLHSVLNTLYAREALADHPAAPDLYELAQHISQDAALSATVRQFASERGFHEVPDVSGTNLDVQVFDTSLLPSFQGYPPEEAPLLLVMDYAFGEQAYECMDELLRPYQEQKLQVLSISIMGKAGILAGGKGDIMLPTAHVFEGTGDNYPFHNELAEEHFSGSGLAVYRGSMTTVLGTSLQNRDVLQHFLTSTWQAVGIEMEGAHYQKAIQSASRIRKSIPPKVKVRYAYYASDNPLQTGSTLSSGGLGVDGIKPTYWITEKILEQIWEDHRRES